MNIPSFVSLKATPQPEEDQNDWGWGHDLAMNIPSFVSLKATLPILRKT